MQFTPSAVGRAAAALAVLGATALSARAEANLTDMLSGPSATVGPRAMASSGATVSGRASSPDGALVPYRRPHVDTGDSRLTINLPDLNGDGKLDVLLQNASNGSVYYWLTDGARITSSNFLFSGNIADWVAFSTQDLNRDGKPDILLRNTKTGAIYYWLTNGTQITSQGFLWAGGGAAEAAWLPIYDADLNGDGSPDLLLENQNTRDVYYWILTNGGTAIGQNGFVYTGNPDEFVITSVDLNRDNRIDLLIRNNNTGAIRYRLLNGVTVSQQGTLWAGGDNKWTLDSVVDLNRDGTPDVVMQYKNTQDPAAAQTDAVYYWMLTNGGTAIGQNGFLWTGDANPGTSWNVVASPDLNGDSNPDLVLQNAANGAVYYWILTSGGTAIGASDFLWTGGDRNWVVKTSFDMNQDGRLDLIFRNAGPPTNANRGAIYYWLLNGTSIGSQGFLWTGGDANWFPFAYLPRQFNL